MLAVYSPLALDSPAPVFGARESPAALPLVSPGALLCPAAPIDKTAASVSLSSLMVRARPR